MKNFYRAEADALDAEILTAIESWNLSDFDDLALRIFAHQLRYNEPYSRYCESLGFSLAALPRSWDSIPPVPAGAFKEAALCTFDPSTAGLVFETSGTTIGTGGLHYMESSCLYDASLLAGFEHALLDGADPLRYSMLLPALEQRPRSSLSYMMDHVARTFGDQAHSWYVDGDTIDAGRFIGDLRSAQQTATTVCVAGTAFAFVHLLDELARLGTPTSLPLPWGSRIMETGGFKGRTRVLDRSELYRQLSDLFSVPPQNIIGEYGMTELCSQYYDESFGEPRSKGAPPWLRSYAVDENGKRVPYGVVGALVHVDLANRSSCVAVQTEDLGAVFEGGGLILIGRERGAELRGCSLDAESLRAAAS